MIDRVAYVVFILVTLAIFINRIRFHTKYGTHLLRLKHVAMENLRQATLSEPSFEEHDTIRSIVFNKEATQPLYASEHVGDDYDEVMEYTKTMQSTARPVFIHIPDMENATHLVAMCKFEDETNISVTYMNT